MKNSMTLIVGILFVIVHTYSQDNAEVFSQLCSLNKEWKNHENFSLPETIQLKNDRELIQLHLMLVESELRNKNISHLSQEQKEKRNEGLDILRAYWKKGLFPVNLYHAERTPYFIDHLGIACAVGHIVIETGYGDFAKQIQNENNYGYIFDLEKQYPQLEDWAFEHGFSMDELAWIQPSYGSCWSTGPGYVNHPNCYGFNDGHIYLEIPAGSTSPYSVSGPPCWALGAGTYDYAITDANGNVYLQSYTLIDPAPIEPIANWISDATSPSSCDGIANVSSTGGIGPLTYYWVNCTGPGLSVNSQTITTLCPGEYKVVINDSIGCSGISTCITIDNLAGIEDLQVEPEIKLFPNPTSDIMTLRTSVNINQIEILNYSGQIVQLIQGNQNREMVLDVSFLPSGYYIVRIIGQSEPSLTSFVKR